MFGWTECVSRRAFKRAAVVLMGLLAATAAQAETRTLKLYHVHLKEKTEITYKRDGKFLPDGLKKANWALRDWRENKPTTMDPKLLDLLYEAHKQSGSRGYIHVIGGYRSPGTNKMLRSRSSGVAGSSLHMSGKAVDFFLPDVPLKKVRDIGLRMQLGGVGYYPRSGSPFVHFDTGKGRYWPRMSRKELASVFPKGNTIHVPADGKPLPGYETALASYNKRKGANDVQIASASRSGGGRSLLAAIFGGGADEAEDEAEATAAPVGRTPAPRPQAAPEPAVQVAAVRPARALPPATLPNGVPMPERDAFDGSSPVRAAPPAGIPAETAVAALVPARVPLPTSAPVRPDAVDPAQTLVAALEAEAAPVEAAPGAPAQLAYAVPTPRARPPFEAVLRGEQAALPTPRMIGAEPDLTPESIIAAAMAESAAAAAGTDGANHPAAVPSHRPAAVAALAATPVPASSGPIRLASLDTAASGTGGAVRRTVSAKGGRVVGDEAAIAAARRAAQPSRRMIAERVEVASLISNPERRALEQDLQRPVAHGLIGNLPDAVFAHGFSRKDGAPAASSRFEGKAVHFMPVRKIN
ncbi:DUF882 domain-containing protein [Aureimonas flava]|uniref:Murein endopeptidase K n=1 Tax=Aureimonas flava TaxID=2320271 RepID=A0A3A1WKY5_9HYPH|nr:DUF882 domain-containing protein [Aureimonas flava]RIY00910.1 DUF882 domain-containing protein [Aureimonas flava]